MTITPNIERLDSLLEWAEVEHVKAEAGLPSEWDQTRWAARTACGTACCLAGKAAIEDGLTPRYLKDGVFHSFELPTGQLIYPAEYARNVLGLTGGQDVLFNEDNTIEDVRDIIRQIKIGVQWPVAPSSLQDDDYEDDDEDPDYYFYHEDDDE